MLGTTNYKKMLLMCTYFHQTTDMTMTTMTEALQKTKQYSAVYKNHSHI